MSGAVCLYIYYSNLTFALYWFFSLVDMLQSPLTFYFTLLYYLLLALLHIWSVHIHYYSLTFFFFTLLLALLSLWSAPIIYSHLTFFFTLLLLYCWFLGFTPFPPLTPSPLPSPPPTPPSPHSHTIQLIFLFIYLFIYFVYHFPLLA